MNRKLSNFVPAASQLVTGMASRATAPTALDYDKEEFERGQTNALFKSLSVDETPAKEKHVRTLVIGTYHTHGSDVFWR